MMLLRWMIRLAQAAAITVTLAAVLQELEKPAVERRWYGKVGPIPYDFRQPSLRRLKELFWNPDSDEIFSPPVWGIGWSINLYALFLRLSIIGESYYSEEDFLIPTHTMRKILEQRQSGYQTFSRS